VSPVRRLHFGDYARVAVLILLTAIAMLLVAASESAFFLAAGSDAGVEIFTPPLVSKIFALVIATGALGWALFGRGARASGRWAAYAVSLAILALATHAVIVDYKQAVLREHWLFMTIDRLSFDAANGLSYDWQSTPSLTGTQLRRRRDGARVFVPSGIAPWRTGFESSAHGNSR